MKVVDIQITEEDIKSLLLSLLNSKNAPLIADVIIGNLGETEVGLNQLYSAINGIIKPVKFKPEDEVFVKPDALYSWEFDKPAMDAAGMFYNGLMRARVTKINQYKKNRITLKYTYIKNNAGEKEYEQDVDENKVFMALDEFIDK